MHQLLPNRRFRARRHARLYDGGMALRRYARFTIPMLTLCLGTNLAAATDAVPQQIAAQLPGWTIAQMVKGDLNRDSLVDVVVALQQPEASEEGTPGRAMLAIFLGGPGGTLRKIDRKSVV